MKIRDKRELPDGVALADVPVGEVFKVANPADERLYLRCHTEEGPAPARGLEPIINLYSGLVEWAGPHLTVFPVDAEIILTGKRGA